MILIVGNDYIRGERREERSKIKSILNKKRERKRRIGSF
jgi:hypothetical protein